ncbi:MAG: hypothetical protein ABIK28_20040, partial [Planctomycetota bacterium]
MFPEKFCKLTLPFSPYTRKGEAEPVRSMRIRPKESLDLAGLVREMRMGTIAAYELFGHPWALISVFSPYTPNAHVMFMESSPDRYLPGPERIPDDEGDHLMQKIAAVMAFLAKRPENKTLHAGYNWAPRSWGEFEEKTGFQSIPTKWHPMLWGWPALESGSEDPSGCVEWVEAHVLSPVERRLFGENDYSLPLCRFIRSRLEQAFAGHVRFHRLFDFAGAAPVNHTLVIPFRRSLPQMFRIPCFFQEILKPVGAVLEKAFRDLTETLTDIDCGARDQLLQQCVTEGDGIWNALRQEPKMRDEADIRSRAIERGIPGELLKVLVPPVRNRCGGGRDPFYMWRVGFGYSLAFSTTV